MMKDKRRVLGIVLLLLSLLCVGYLICYQMKKDRNNDIYEEMQKEVVGEREEEKEEYVSPVDFDALQKMNPDIYAWISIPGTEVNYPILQSSTDDSYYLNHTVEGQEGYPGSIYTESCNGKDFTDYNTVIYGHNMKDGSMFRKLEDYKDKAFWEKNPYFYIYTPDGRELTYHIYSVATVEDTSDTYLTTFASTEEYQKFLDMTKADADYDTGVEVGVNDTIVTLSTCTRESDNHRIVVRGVKEKDVVLKEN